MKKNAIFTFLILSAILILDSFGVGHALVMFLLAGIIPGTNIVLSAQAMLNIIAIVAGFSVARVFVRILAFVETHRSTEQAQTQSRRVNKARA